MEKIITYIDGFNLYFGLKSRKWKRYYWLNLVKLSENLLKQNQTLVRTKYFTARISNPPGKVARQGIFIEALMTLKNFGIFYGKYKSNFHECKRCRAVFETPNEKMTDVNIATELLSDAFANAFDTAFLVSADSDLVAPVRKVLVLYPKKRIICVFPPDRFSKELSKIASGYFTIGRKKLSESVFPGEVLKADGFVLKKPPQWV